MNKFLFTFFLLILHSVSIFANEKNVTGAACFVSDNQGRVLVTRDILTNKIAIPGGYIGNDKPREAAKRETFEETGIRVEIIGELARLGNAILFDCRATEIIIIHNINESIASVSAWKAPHFGREVRAVYLMDPSVISLAQSRFPEQVQLFSTWITNTAPSATEHVENFAHQASSFVLKNASINQAFQSNVQSLPQPIFTFLDVLLKSLSLLGNGTVFFLLLPFAMASGGLKRTAELLLVSITVGVVVSLMKLSFAVPRPFYVYPDLQRGLASGFAFPSGHAATAFAAWGLIYFWLKQAGTSSLFLWGIAPILVAVSRVYLGVHYVTDVIAGACVGIVIVVMSHYICKRNLILSAPLWGGVGLLTVPLAMTQIHPIFVYCAIFSLTFSLQLLIFKPQLFDSAMKFNWVEFILTFLGGVSIIAAIIALEQIVSVGIIIANSIGAILLAIWLCVVPRCALKITR